MHVLTRLDLESLHIDVVLGGSRCVLAAVVQEDVTCVVANLAVAAGLVNIEGDSFHGWLVALSKSYGLLRNDAAAQVVEHHHLVQVLVLESFSLP